MDPEVMHELEGLEELRKQLEKRVEEQGERLDRLEAERIKVSYPGRPPFRCQSVHVEGIKCELVEGHPGKHLGGTLMWAQ